MKEHEKLNQPGKKFSADRWIKIGFVVVVIGIAAVILMLQWGGLEIKGWDSDLEAALKQSKTENRNVLIFFTSSRPGDTALKISKTLAKPASKKAIKDGNFIRVIVGTSLKSETARRYRINKLPTMVILTPTGTELNRREGFIGEGDFHTGFLDCTKILEP